MNDSENLDSKEDSEISSTNFPSQFAVLKSSWNLYVEKFGILSSISLIFTAVMMGIVFLLGLFDLDALSDKEFFIVATVVWIVAFVLLSWTQLTLITVLVKDEEEIDVRTAFSNSFKNILSYIWILVIVGILIAGSYFFFVVPGIVFSIWLLFSGFVFVNDGSKGLKAIVKSREYTRGIWSHLLSNFIFLALLMIFFAILFSIATSGFGKEASKEISNLLMSIFILPFVIVYKYTLFDLARKRKIKIFEENIKFKDWYKYLFFPILGFLMIPVFIWGAMKWEKSHPQKVNTEKIQNVEQEKVDDVVINQEKQI